MERFIEKEGKESNSQGVKRELAFTFSFPVKHSSISSGVLIKWTKGFEISEMVSKIILKLLLRFSVIVRYCLCYSLEPFLLHFKTLYAI